MILDIALVIFDVMENRPTCVCVCGGGRDYYLSKIHEAVNGKLLLNYQIILASDCVYIECIIGCTLYAQLSLAN